MYGKYRKRISKKRNPRINKWLHYGKRAAAAASGAALGFIYRGLPGAYSGGKLGWNMVGQYHRPYQAVLGSNRKVVLGSNYKNPYPGSFRYHHPVYDRDPVPQKGGSGSNPRDGSRKGAFKWVKDKGWTYAGGTFNLGSKHRRGHRGKHLISRKY